MNSLNIFKMLHWSFRDPINNFRNIKKIIKYSWQRITKGYCDYDRYDIDRYLIDLLPNMLEDLADKTHSYPAGFNDLECWQNHLRHIADRFKNAKDFYDLSDDVENYSMEERIEFYNKSELCLKTGFEYLENHYWDLWD